MKRKNFTPCEDDSLPEFPHIVYFGDEYGKTYFDATHCLERSEGADGSSVGDFRQKFAFPVEILCERWGVSEEDFVVENADTGHEMVHECGVFCFFSYTDRRFIPYMFLRTMEMLTLGFTVCDDVLNGLYRERFGNDD